jgi:trans-aconitate methyltransferase
MQLRVEGSGTIFAGKGLKDAYPAQSDGKVLLAYPRLFIVATR